MFLYNPVAAVCVSFIDCVFSSIKPDYLYLLLLTWLLICFIDCERGINAATAAHGLAKYNKAGPAKAKALSSSPFIRLKKRTMVGIRGDQEAAQRSRRPTAASKRCSLCPNCLLKNDNGETQPRRLPSPLSRKSSRTAAEPPAST